jgi:hypothetical protein
MYVTVALGGTATLSIDYTTMTELSSLAVHFKHIVNPTFQEDVVIYGVGYPPNDIQKYRHLTDTVDTTVAKLDPLGGTVFTIREATGLNIFLLTQSPGTIYALDEDL